MDQGLNWSLAEAVNGLAGHVAALDALGIFLANYLVFLVVLSAAIWWFIPFGSDAGKRAALAAAAAVVCGLAVSVVITHLSYVPRPFVAHASDVHLLIHHAADSSFPSDHTTAAFAAASTALVRRMPGRWIMLIGAVLVAVGRVYVGAHYPADVIVGALIGAFWAIAFLRLDTVLAPPADLAIGVARRFGLG